MPLPETADELQIILDEITQQTDRGAAIIATAMLDEMLAEALWRRLILTNSLRERLFSYEKNGPLSTFSSKIDLAFAVGLLKPETRNDLHVVRRIRNKFAHQLEPLTFAEKEVAALCETLAIARGIAGWDKFAPRLRFNAAFSWLLIALRLLRSAEKLSLAERWAYVDEMIRRANKVATADEPATIWTFR
jgi:DNA-binding MltR family transcriptional regulator